jgi:hypothetical protein
VKGHLKAQTPWLPRRPENMYSSATPVPHNRPVLEPSQRQSVYQHHDSWTAGESTAGERLGQAMQAYSYYLCRSIRDEPRRRTMISSIPAVRNKSPFDFPSTTSTPEVMGEMLLPGQPVAHDNNPVCCSNTDSPSTFEKVEAGGSVSVTRNSCTNCFQTKVKCG